METLLHAKELKDMAASVIVAEFRNMDLTAEQYALLVAFDKANEIWRAEAQKFDAALRAERETFDAVVKHDAA